jgi:iron(II)-dependent oxidoreductase
MYARFTAQQARVSVTAQRRGLTKDRSLLKSLSSFIACVDVWALRVALLCCSLLCCSLLSPVSVSLAAPHLERVAVFELKGEGEGEVKRDISELLRGTLAEALGEEAQVLSRENLYALVPAERLALLESGALDELGEVALGRLVRAQVVVSGELKRLGPLLTLRVKVHEAQSGRLRGLRELAAPTLTRLRARVPSLALRLTELISPEGAGDEPREDDEGLSPKVSPSRPDEHETSQGESKRGSKRSPQRLNSSKRPPQRLNSSKRSPQRLNSSKRSLTSRLPPFSTLSSSASLPSPQAPRGMDKPSHSLTHPLTPPAEPLTPSAPSELRWVALPAGEVRLGDPLGEPDERAVVTRSVARFWISVREVSEGAYQRCVEAGACASLTPCGAQSSRPALRTSLHTSLRASVHQPVRCVSWEEASAFARWLGGALPSEAQWRYAAQLDLADLSPDELSLDELLERAWFDEGEPHSALSAPQEGCKKSAGRLGLCDLLGNVWEWTSDLYAPYDEPSRAEAASLMGRAPSRVVRGGGWRSPRAQLRVSNRLALSPHERRDDVGFRVVRFTPPPHKDDPTP